MAFGVMTSFRVWEGVLHYIVTNLYKHMVFYKKKKKNSTYTRQPKIDFACDATHPQPERRTTLKVSFFFSGSPHQKLSYFIYNKSGKSLPKQSICSTTVLSISGSSPQNVPSGVGCFRMNNKQLWWEEEENSTHMNKKKPISSPDVFVQWES